MSERLTKDKVLVIDDEQMIRYTLTQALRSWGYGVTEAGSLAAGLAAFDAEQPDMVLLDINLPDGSGIDAQDLPRVFNRFDRVAEAGVRGEAALGLGLPLTQQFIEAHGGTVELESEKGKGTTVTLTIPRGSR